MGRQQRLRGLGVRQHKAKQKSKRKRTLDLSKQEARVLRLHSKERQISWKEWVQFERFKSKFQQELYSPNEISKLRFATRKGLVAVSNQNYSATFSPILSLLIILSFMRKIFSH